MQKPHGTGKTERGLASWLECRVGGKEVECGYGEHVTRHALSRIFSLVREVIKGS